MENGELTLRYRYKISQHAEISGFLDFSAWMQLKGTESGVIPEKAGGSIYATACYHRLQPKSCFTLGKALLHSLFHLQSR